MEAEGRVRRSWRLTRTAWSTIRGDRTLLVLAAASGLFGLGATLVLFGVSGYLGDPQGSTSRLALLAAVLSYPATFVSTFLGTAVAAASAGAMDGRPLALREALRVPAGRLGQVALWSALATGVGLLLEQVVARIPGAGRVVSWVAGAAWSLATLFAVPILALEGCTAPACARRSARLVRERWGEAVSGNLAITAWAVIPGVLGGAIIGVGAGVEPDARAVGIALIASGALVLTAVSAVMLTVRQTFAVALYRHATSSAGAGGPFDRADLDDPFRRTSRRLRRRG